MSFISFNSLFNKNLDNTREPEIKTAVFHTMVFEDILLGALFKKKVPITLFMDRPASESKPGSYVKRVDKLNMNVVYPKKNGFLGHGCFHSKLMLLEFDDRLRVVVTSANLIRMDWFFMSNVIWI